MGAYVSIPVSGRRMASETTKRANGSIADLLANLVEGLARLMSEHLTLARLELSNGARELGRRLAWLALFAPMILVGYAFLCAAAAQFLTRWMSLTAALVAVGATNAVVGAIGAQRVVARMRSRGVMNGTVQELSRSSAMLASRSEPTRSEVSNVR